MRPIACLLACLLLALPAWAQSPSPGVRISAAWARATPGQSTTAAVFVTLQSAAGDRLTGVGTPIAGSAELHQDSDDHGVMQMRALDGVDLPAGRPVDLKPGGTHIMLMDLKQKLVMGASFPLTLTFRDAGAVATTVRVLAPGAMGPGMADMPGMTMPSRQDK